MPLFNNDSQLKGIYRAILLSNDLSNNARVYIPSILNNNIPCPIYSDGQLNPSVYNENINSYPIARWVNPNLAQLSSTSGAVACWVIFEDGNINYPVIIAYFSNTVLMGNLSFSSGAPGNTYSGGTIDNENAMIVFNRLIWHGASIGGACAVLAMMYSENHSFNPNSDPNVAGAIGICQWTGTRKTALQAKSGWQTLEVQTDFFVEEIKAGVNESQHHVTWDDITKTYTNNDIDKMKDLLFRLKRYYEIPWTWNSRDQVKNIYEKRWGEWYYYEDNMIDAENKLVYYWNQLKNGTIQNGKYISNNLSGNNRQQAMVSLAKTFTGGTWIGTPGKNPPNGKGSGTLHYCEAWVEHVYCNAINGGNQKTWVASANAAYDKPGSMDLPTDYSLIPLGIGIYAYYGNNAGHATIYIGNGEVASNANKCPQIETIDSFATWTKNSKGRTRNLKMHWIFDDDLSIS